MASEKAPAFQFYPKDFLTDSNVVAMTLQELGAYIRLICLCWLDGSVPKDGTALARLCRVSETCMMRLWPALDPCFVERNGRLIQPRLEREREKQESYRAMKAAAGQKGGRPKADRKQKLNRSQVNESPPSSSSIFISDLPSSSSDQELSSADADFEAFRQAYPASRRVGGKLARTAFDRAICRQTVAGLMTALEQHKRSEQWQTPKLIPLMTTWLNQERWVQVLPEPAQPSRRGSTCPHEPQCRTQGDCTMKIIADGRRERGEAAL